MRHRFYLSITHESDLPKDENVEFISRVFAKVT